MYGTQVPRIDEFREEDQLHGRIILQLKKKWPCAQHYGEHGEPGFCYIAASGERVGLNTRKLKIWAAAIVSTKYWSHSTCRPMNPFQAASDATKHEPPNTIEFDGVCDGRLISGRSRVRGNHPAAPPATDPTMLLMASLIPLLTGLSRPHEDQLTNPAMPIVRQASNTILVTPMDTPMPGEELHACLLAFKEEKGIDLLHIKLSLADLDLTPDILGRVPVAWLCAVMGAIKGQIWKFQAFATEWSAWLEAQKAAGTKSGSATPRAMPSLW
jgi:hypothetical protein